MIFFQVYTIHNNTAYTLFLLCLFFVSRTPNRGLIRRKIIFQASYWQSSEPPTMICQAEEHSPIWIASDHVRGRSSSSSTATPVIYCMQVCSTSIIAGDEAAFFPWLTNTFSHTVWAGLLQQLFCSCNDIPSVGHGSRSIAQEEHMSPNSSTSSHLPPSTSSRKTNKLANLHMLEHPPKPS